MTNPYDTLGVAKNASADEIKKAYRKLAREHHPDASGGDEARFKEIQGAYDVLSDPEKRQAVRHLRLGERADGRRRLRGRRRRSSRTPTSTSPTSSAASSAAARQRGPVPERGAGRRGAHHALVRRRAPAAPRCGFRSRSRPPAGRAAAPAPSRARRPIVCPQCGGRGVVSDSQGLFSLSHPCPQLPRQRHDRRASVQDLPRLRPRADDEELQRQDPAGDQGRRAHPRRRQGRGGTERRPGRRPLRRRRTSSRRRSTPGAATT